MIHSEMPTTKRVLHSWKEIANYTGRGVRTVQRYELQYGFPVRRPAGGPRSAVLALCGEIDDWLAKSPRRPDLIATHPIAKNGGNTLATSLCAKITSAHERSELLKNRADNMMKRLKQSQSLCEQLQVTWQRTLELREKMIALPSAARSRSASAGGSSDPSQN